MMKLVLLMLKIVAILVAVAIVWIASLWMTGTELGFRIGGHLFADGAGREGGHLWLIAFLVIAELLILSLLRLLSWHAPGRDR
jgi:hypothetical protein